MSNKNNLSKTKPDLNETLEWLSNDDQDRVTKPIEDNKMKPVRLTEDGETGDRFLVYSTQNGVEVQLQYEGNDLWMTQSQIADLYGVTRPNIVMHLTNIYSENELKKKATSKESLLVRNEGNRRVSRSVTLYNLDIIISVGYRVSSKQGTLVRKWATQKLVQFATKGFVVDAEKLKDPENHDHLRELREIIRDIRASETNVHKEVRRICTLCQDYADLNEREKGSFFATLQNKLHYAVTGMTGAEIRKERADYRALNMGLTSWSGDRPTQKDTLTAKNFLGELEIKDLNRFTGMLLDYFEQETELQRLVLMSDAKEKLDQFIRNNERPLLKDLGKISKSDADKHVKVHYEKYKEEQRLIAQEQSMKDD